MKKIIIAIISAMILMPTMADAQIKKSNTQCRSVRSFGARDVDLIYQDGTFAIVLNTTDRYGEYQYSTPIKIILGKTKKETINSLSFLIDTINSMDKFSFIIINDGKRDYQIYKTWKGCRRALRIFTEGYEGCTSITRRDLIHLKIFLEWYYND